MVEMSLLWLGLLAAFALLELSLENKTAVCFSGGALAAAVAALIAGSLWIQLLTFAAVSAALVFTLRPYMKKRAKRNAWRK